MRIRHVEASQASNTSWKAFKDGTGEVEVSNARAGDLLHLNESPVAGGLAQSIVWGVQDLRQEAHARRSSAKLSLNHVE